MTEDQTTPPQPGPKVPTFEEGAREGRRLCKKFSDNPNLHWVEADNPRNAVHQKAKDPDLCLYQGQRPCLPCKGKVEADGNYVLCKLAYPARNPLHALGVDLDREEEEKQKPLTSMV
jgi:hypothetical protein